MAKKKDFSEEATEMDIDLGELEEGSKPKKEMKGDVTDTVADMTEDLPIHLVAVLGRKKMALGDLLKLKVGQSIHLDRAPNEFVDIEANGKLVARGELVEIDGKLGVRIIKLLK